MIEIVPTFRLGLWRSVHVVVALPFLAVVCRSWQSSACSLPFSPF